MARVPPPKRKQVARGLARKSESGGRLSDKDVALQRKRLLQQEKSKMNAKKKKKGG